MSSNDLFTAFVALVLLGIAGASAVAVVGGLVFAIRSFMERDLSGFFGLGSLFLGVIGLLFSAWIWSVATAHYDPLPEGCYRLHYELEFVGKTYVNVPIYDPVRCP